MSKKLVVYTLGEACIRCKMTTKKLDQMGVKYEVLDAKENLEFLKSLGFCEAPVVRVLEENDKEVASWSGYRPDKMHELIK